MRVPTTVKLFALGALLGTLLVAAPRVLDSRRAYAGPQQPATAPPGTASPSEPAPAAALPAGRQTDTPLPDEATVALRNKASRVCLDSNGAGEVYVLGCNGGAFQSWTVTVSKDTRIFRDVATGRCLENRERGAAKVVFTAACDRKNVFQNWFFISDVNLVSLQNDTTRLCLWDAPPASTTHCDKNKDNLWWEVVTR